MEASYEFDPCTLDGSDVDDEEVTIDNWKPTPKSHKIIKSEWREKQNDGKHNLQPGLDDLKKINIYLKRKYPDSQIMDAFGITAETLIAIKRNCYSPVDGISLDNQSKIYRKFNLLDKKISNMFEALKLIADSAFEESDTVKRMAFKTFIGMRKKKAGRKKLEDIEDASGEEE